MTQTTKGRERRRYPRIDRPLRIRVAGEGEQVATQTVNVSCGGTLCWLEQPLPSMTKVAVSLALPKRLVRCIGVVVRCQPVPAVKARDHGRYRAALLFTDLSRDDHRAIAEFVLDSMFTRMHGRRRP